MPSINRKICQSCNTIITTKSCDKCIKDNAKQYDEQVRDKDSYAVYHSTRWKKVRKFILKRDFGICKRCGHANKIMIVDHIKELKDYPELAYNYENLEVLCVPCHNTKSAESRRDGGRV